MAGNRRSGKMLVALDGSAGAYEAVKYICGIPALQALDIRLFSVFTRIPERYWDLTMQPLLGDRMRDIRAWEVQNEKAIEGHLAKAKQRLVHEGFSEDRVKICVKEKQVGVARDILRETSEGYMAVVVGRRGMSKLKDLVMGSIASKLLEKVSFKPLIIVGRNPKAGKVLLAFDGSENGMRMVDFVGQTLGKSGLESLLLHVVRSSDRGYIQEAEAMMSQAFGQATSRLIQSGFPEGQLKIRIITGARSRAETIVKTAREEGYGTVVVGRRGLSRVTEFFMGRVSNKVVQLAKGQAVWVVS
jgi:nucleotide-binding universal stress UspA family protein